MQLNIIKVTINKGASEQRNFGDALMVVKTQKSGFILILQLKVDGWGV